MVLNCRRNCLNMISEIRLRVSVLLFISLQSHFKIDHRISKLLSVEVFSNTSKLQSNIAMKWPAGNLNIHISQKKGDTRSLCICYLIVIEGK